MFFLRAQFITKTTARSAVDKFDIGFYWRRFHNQYKFIKSSLTPACNKILYKIKNGKINQSKNNNTKTTVYNRVTKERTKKCTNLTPMLITKLQRSVRPNMGLNKKRNKVFKRKAPAKEEISLLIRFNTFKTPVVYHQTGK